MTKDESVKAWLEQEWQKHVAFLETVEPEMVRDSPNHVAFLRHVYYSGAVAMYCLITDTVKREDGRAAFKEMLGSVERELAGFIEEIRKRRQRAE